MNVVNTSNKSTVTETQNSANSPHIEQASCSFYPVVHDKDMTVTNLPLLKPTANQQDQASVMENWENNTQSDWVAEPEDEALITSEFQQLLALNQELCSANSELYTQVGQLKDELAGAEKILQWQKTRSSVTESMLTDQTKELTAAQEQIQYLSNQLEAALQTIEQQEIFVETYKSQLQISQQRIAQLERECSSLQTNYSEQSQQMVQSENTCRELRSRLMRQQRQTLQFKVALEKCLDTPVPHYDTLEDTNHATNDIGSGQTRFSRKARSLFPNAQPIKPWSAEVDGTNQPSYSWIETTSPPLHRNNSTTSTSPSDDKENPELQIPSTPSQPSSRPDEDESMEYPKPDVETDSCNIEQNLESLIQMFFAAQESSVTPTNPPTATIVNPTPTVGEDAHSNQPDVPVWDTPVSSISNLDSDQQSEQTVEVNVEPIITLDQQTNDPESEDYWSEVSSTTENKLPENDASPFSLTEYPPESKSPSPLIYPQRPPKGRKSLASVELPNFRPLDK